MCFHETDACNYLKSNVFFLYIFLHLWSTYCVAFGQLHVTINGWEKLICNLTDLLQWPVKQSAQWIYSFEFYWLFSPPETVRNYIYLFQISSFNYAISKLIMFLFMYCWMLLFSPPYVLVVGLLRTILLVDLYHPPSGTIGLSLQMKYLHCKKAPDVVPW